MLNFINILTVAYNSWYFESVYTLYYIYIRRREWRRGRIVSVVERSPFGLQKDYIWEAKGVLLEGKRSPFGGQKGYIWRAKGVLLGNYCFYIRKRREFYGVRRNNRSGYGGGAIASYNDAIASYVIANLLRNTPSRATTTHAICCAT